jgi:transcriptional regulator GlxA family with amidase domain
MLWGVTDGWTRRLLRVKDLMDRAYAEPLGVPAMAELVFASADHFTRRFKQSFGETPHQYLLTRRMERAKASLRDSDLGLSLNLSAFGVR